MTAAIRPLGPDEPELYREIRLEALRLHPDAFGASFEEESARPLGFFEQRLAANTIFGGFIDGKLMGTAGFMPGAGAKHAHKGYFWGMYVRKPARGSGLARFLVDSVLDYAKDRVEIIQLTVGSDNAGARRLYETVGFDAFGTEKRSLKVDDRYLDEIHMMKMLT